MTHNTALKLLGLGLLGSWQIIHADAFLDVNGVFTTISAPGAEPGTTVATGINDSGQIVGYFANSFGGMEGFLDANGAFTTISEPAENVMLSGINDAGLAVGTIGGFSLIGGGSFFNNAFLYMNGTFTTFEVPTCENTIATAVNDLGQIGAYSYNCSVGALEGNYLYSNGNLTPAPLDPLGINDSGEIVNGQVYANGVFTTLSAPGDAPGTIAFATGINNLGQIVGFFLDASGAQHGFLDTNGTFQTIDVPGAISTTPAGINDVGEIVGTFAPVPEPASFVLTASGLAGIVALKRYRRTRGGTM
jgi:probable HAF family extracellular repeat protein